MRDYNVMLLRIQNSKDEEIKDGVYEIAIRDFDISKLGWQFHFNLFLKIIFDICELKFNKLSNFYKDRLEYFSCFDYNRLVSKNTHWTQGLSNSHCIWELAFLNKLPKFYKSILVDIDFNINTIYLARRIPYGCIVPIPPIIDFLSDKLIKDNKFNISVDYTHFTNGDRYNRIEFFDDFNNKIDFNKIDIKKKNLVNYFDYDIIYKDFENYINGEKTFSYNIKQHSHIISKDLELYITDEYEEREFYGHLGFYISKVYEPPSGCLCPKCGKWVYPCDDDFIEAFEKENSKEGVDYIIYDEICEECDW